MPTLISDWRRVLKKAWSVRLMALAAALSGVEVALPFFFAEPTRLFAVASGVVAMAALFARFVAQSRDE